MKNVGLDETLVIDKTPEFIWRNLTKEDYFNENYEEIYENTRGVEIDEWLNKHSEVDNYVIIDDRTDFTESQLSHFVFVNSMNGLLDKHVEKAIRILLGKSTSRQYKKV